MAKATIEALQAADILITTKEDTKRVFGIERESYEEVVKTLAERFSLEAVAITLRETPSVRKNRGILPDFPPDILDGRLASGPTKTKTPIANPN